MSLTYLVNLICGECGSPFEGGLDQRAPANMSHIGTCRACFDKRSIKLKFFTYYPGGHSFTETRFLPDTSASLVIKKLLEGFFKAGYPSEECYELAVERNGKTFSADQSLEDAQVQAGDTIVLRKVA